MCMYVYRVYPGNSNIQKPFVKTTAPLSLCTAPTNAGLRQSAAIAGVSAMAFASKLGQA